MLESVGWVSACLMFFPTWWVEVSFGVDSILCLNNVPVGFQIEYYHPSTIQPLVMDSRMHYKSQLIIFLFRLPDLKVCLLQVGLKRYYYELYLPKYWNSSWFFITVKIAMVNSIAGKQALCACEGGSLWKCSHRKFKICMGYRTSTHAIQIK